MGLLVAWTSGLVGILITKVEEKLLPKDGARERLSISEGKLCWYGRLGGVGDSAGHEGGDALLRRR